MIFKQTPSMLSSGNEMAFQLNTSLAKGESVIWLLGGGSNIALSVQIMLQLPTQYLSRLVVMFTDERYGPWGHPDSNYKQLVDAGFDPRGATIVPMLSPENPSLAQSVQDYTQKITNYVSNADTVIGQFGMGADGHIAGILPNSVAASSEDWVVGYDAGQFTRITIGLEVVQWCDYTYLYAFGAEKAAALHQLHDTNVPVQQQPAQILREIDDAIIYNDIIGDTA